MKLLILRRYILKWKNGLAIISTTILLQMVQKSFKPCFGTLQRKTSIVTTLVGAETALDNIALLKPNNATEATQIAMLDRIRGISSGVNGIKLNLSNLPTWGEDQEGNADNYVVYTTHLRRDDTQNQAEGFPRYIYENRFYNDAAVTTADEISRSVNTFEKNDVNLRQ